MAQEIIEAFVSPVATLGLGMLVGMVFGGMIAGEAKGRRLLRGDREIFEPRRTTGAPRSNSCRMEEQS